MTDIPEVPALLDSLEQSLRDTLSDRGIADPLLVGIRTGGVWIARELHRRLGLDEPFGELDISFYRDDFSRIGLNPRVTPSHLPFETEDRDLVLVDDVVMSGRTIRAAMNELFDYGRPSSITLVALIDLGGRDLPIQPDVVAHRLELPSTQRVKLVGPAPLKIEVREVKA
ncbi:bifunctional pyr operon transcriptional regulator/uracil phosphoribosyltransferase PyrR [Marinobacter sp. M1N3S26]|uniref:bifunctional pyr operon transcriptional regulator/uracil phosphoribosyltransferase PyrR n=1 Tax=unclassified Marinobacter TaxID=83889 RepID=UPI00387AEBE9